MGTMLDLFFAATVTGLLMLSVISLNDDLVMAQHSSVVQHSLQSRSADLQRLLLRDLRMAGHGAAPGTGIIRAFPTLLELRGDFLRDGAQHTVRYALGDTTSASMTEHPQDRILWRSIDGGEPQAYAFGLVDLQFTYLDSNGTAASDSCDVRRVLYQYTLESSAPYGDDSPSIYVSGGISPRNLQ